MKEITGRMMHAKTIERVAEESKNVILDCCFPNGAIVAANSSKSYYPKQAKNYRFVWPRDAMYACIAADILGLDIQEKFFKWCMKAESWERTGLFYEKYYVNGKKARFNLQPDQTGSVLIALHYFFKKCPGRFERLIRKSADGLCRIWDKNHFNVITQDLWEERLCFPDLREGFSYSAAVCARGLECANEIMPNRRWKEVSRQMRDAVLKSKGDFFYRSFGKINDFRTDASLLGLVWPSGLVKADNIRMKNTVKLIEKGIAKGYEVHRYENDDYDGWMYRGMHRKKGAGYWPLLNFWMSVYYAEEGNKRKAMRYYNRVISDLDGKTHIPEQIFKNKAQVSVSPLCWSHSMFVIASRKLGIF